MRRTLPDDESLLLASYLTVLHVWCRHAGNHMTCRCGNEFCFMCKVGDSLIWVAFTTSPLRAQLSP